MRAYNDKPFFYCFTASLVEDFQFQFRCVRVCAYIMRVKGKNLRQVSRYAWRSRTKPTLPLGRVASCWASCVQLASFPGTKAVSFVDFHFLFLPVAIPLGVSDIRASKFIIKLSTLVRTAVVPVIGWQQDTLVQRHITCCICPVYSSAGRKGRRSVVSVPVLSDACILVQKWGKVKVYFFVDSFNPLCYA